LDITSLTTGKLTAFLDQYDDRSLTDTAARDGPCGVSRANGRGSARASSQSQVRSFLWITGCPVIQNSNWTLRWSVWQHKAWKDLTISHGIGRQLTPHGTLLAIITYGSLLIYSDGQQSSDVGDG